MNNLSKTDDLVNSKDRITAISGTVLLMAILAIMAVLFGFKSTNTLSNEEGAYVLLGVTEFGSPGESTTEFTEYQPEVNPSSPPSEVIDAPVITQEIDQSEINIPKSEEKKNKPQEKTEPAKEEKKANPKFQFQTGNNSGTKGNTTTPGDQGSPTGDPNANRYGPGGGSGYSFNLSGRTVILAPPKIEDNTQQTAKIVIEVTVNRNGTVISSIPVYKHGATTAIGPLAEKAAAAAMKVKFSPNPDAPEEQYGTITFNFKLN